ALLFSACTQGPVQPPDAKKPVALLDPKVAPVVDPQAAGEPKGDPDPAKLPVKPLFVVDDKQEKYEAALNDALDHLAKREFQEALEAMEAARAIDDNDFIRGEIGKLKERMEQDGTAKTAVQNIETVLAEGKAAEAAKLST